MVRMYSGSSDSGGSYGSSPQARKYNCKICGNGFNSGQSLGGHMNVHRGDPRSGSTPPGPASREYNSSPNSSSSSSNFKGVRFRSEQHKWVAEIRPPKSNKTWWLGTYGTPVEAAYAYDVAITYFGSETALNFDGHPVYDQIPRISPHLSKQDFAEQLRKVVKEYGKLAMGMGLLSSHHHRSESDDDDEEDEEEASTSCDANDRVYSDSPYQQQEEYVVTRDVAEINWDDFPDSFQPDQRFSTSYDHDNPFDFEMAPTATVEPIGYSNSRDNYNQPASDYAPSGNSYDDYYYHQVSPPIASPQVSEYEPGNEYYNEMPPALSSDYGPSGYNIFSGSQPQQQFWSPYCCSQYTNY